MLVYKAQASLSKSPGPPPVQHCGGGACGMKQCNDNNNVKVLAVEPVVAQHPDGAVSLIQSK